MSSYWDNEIVRIALPKVFTKQNSDGTTKAAWLAGVADGLKKHIRECQEQLTIVEDMQHEYESRICPRCYGTGNVREQISHDESHMIECPQCKGSGLPPQEQKG